MQLCSLFEDLVQEHGFSDELIELYKVADVLLNWVCHEI